MLDLSGMGAFQLMQGAERLKSYILHLLGNFRGRGEDKHDVHRRSIIMAYLTCRLLQLDYKGPVEMWKITEEAEELLADSKQPYRKS